MWAAGDEVRLVLGMPVQVISAHPAVDAVRGCVALQRGPLVYCLQQRDQPDELSLDDVRIDLSAPIEAVTAADGTVTLTGLGRGGTARSWAGGLYRPAAEPDGPDGPPAPAQWVAEPYYRWANRGESPMRVWLPASAEGG
jgi:DUF1680 family protein